MAATLSGCINGGPVSGAKLSHQDDFFPGEWANNKVVLRLANIDIKGEIEMQVEGQERVLNIVSEGSLIEEEKFRVTTEGIWLVQLGSGETFSEPMPLMKFPMVVGSRFEWEGNIGFGLREVPATAEIKTRRDTLTLATGQDEAVHVQVDLKMHDGSPQPAQRRLDFWFVKGKGPIKRDYGNMIREPRVASE